MKSILLLLLIGPVAFADPVPAVALVSGRPLEQVEVIGATSTGIRLKSRSGTGVYKWELLPPDSLRALGALERPKDVNARIDAANKDIPPIWRDKLLDPYEPEKGEEPEKFLARMEKIRDVLGRSLTRAGADVEKAKTPEARDRAISYALGIALRLHEVDAILAAD